METDAYELAKYIGQAKKKTPAKAYINGHFAGLDFTGIKAFGCDSFRLIIGELSDINAFVEKNRDKITDMYMETDRRNSAINLLDTSKLDARIEPGSIIREQVSIGKKAVIMMGAVINIGCEIGNGTMIDMNAVVGARAKIGSDCHIGAGAVIAGVLEPPSASPVVIEDSALIGANAAILEGVKIGEGAVVAAGSVVTEDVPPHTVVAGSPAVTVKNVDKKTQGKTKLMSDLRK